MAAAAKFELTEHYNGQAKVKFYPGMHGYFVDDSYVDADGKVVTLKNQRMGGGTSVTGIMAKGQGLMLYPMYEMRKYLKLWARTHTFEEIMASPLNWDDILKEGTQAHVKKSDRGKSVGTDAHAWVELYLRELLRVQEAEQSDASSWDPFKAPDIPEVDELKDILRRSYLALFNATKPTDFDGYKSIGRLLTQDAEVQESIWTEATMLRRSILAAKEWMDMHKIFVHGTEDTVYSRTLQVCGKYDGDLSVTCTKDCNWCYRNGDVTLPEEDFTGRYIEDFKSTNVSSEAPKGVYAEYLAQCGVYDIGKTEEFPDIVYDGHLILNGSKNPIENSDGTPILNKKTKQPLKPFNTHFSFERERNRRWAADCSRVRDTIYVAKKEVERSA